MDAECRRRRRRWIETACLIQFEALSEWRALN